MSHGEELLRDFRGLGAPGPWLAALAVASAVWVFAGRWSPWHDIFALALGSHAVAYALVSACRPRLRAPFSFAVPLAIATLGCIGGGISAAALLRGLQGTWRQSTGHWAFDVGLGIAFSALTIIPMLVLRRSDDLRRQRTDLAHAAALQRENDRKRVVEMELKALQAQIEPHFLYNTLANVQHLVRRDPAAADRMLESLIHYLKTSLPQMRSQAATVEEELARVKAYLAVMQVRMQSRLSYRIEVSESALAQKLPPLSILTLVENAVKHGLDPRPEGGEVRVLGGLHGGMLELAVQDDGVGFVADAGAGVGLTNLRSRLQALYGSAAELQLARAADGGVEALLRVPGTR